MNSTLKLLRVIGSPFASEQKLLTNREEALELYGYATKNKIGLLYLEALNNQGKLEEFQLVSNYEKEQKKHDVQLITARRIAELLNSSGINYAIFKSIMLFPATPNDVDILHFGADSEYERAVEIMLQSNYIEVKGKADARQRMFHDIRDGYCPNPHPEKKDVYDVDLYQEVTASYLVYLDKVKLVKYVTEINIKGNHLKVLRPGAELVAIVIHSIIPEQLFTFFTYYATLHYLVRMNSEKICRFINIARENNVTFPMKAHCSLVAELHKVAHGFAPEKIGAVLVGLSDETGKREKLSKNNFRMPHRYSWSTITKTLWGKMKEDEFRKSMAKQAVSMLDLRLAKWVISNVIWRRRRETY